LAALFDPEPNTFPGGERELKFQNRKPGHPRGSFRNSQIAAFIRARMEAVANQRALQSSRRNSVQTKRRTLLAAAVEEASAKFGIDERRVYQIWNRYEKIDSFAGEEPRVTFYSRVVEE
jgi:hypothetical protein